MTLAKVETPSSDTDVVPIRALRPRIIVPSVFGFIIGGGSALIWLPQLLVDNWLQGQANVDSATLRLAVSNAAQIVLFSLGGIIALVGVGLSLSRHGLEIEMAEHDRAKERRRIAELDRERTIDSERELRSRFTQAVSLLSDPEKFTTRQAGVYALGALADDWIEHGRLDEKQVCIDVLCGYLRSAWVATEATAEDERRIRAAAFDLIAAHLRDNESRPSWAGSVFNLRGAPIDYDIDFRGATTKNSRIDLGGSKFIGGLIRFDNTDFTGSNVSFSESEFSGAQVMFDAARFSRGTLDLSYSSFEGGVIRFIGSDFSGSSVLFEGATFNGATIRFDAATFSGGAIRFDHAEFAGGTLTFSRTEFSGSSVTFVESKFTGSAIRFTGTRLTGGSLNFESADFVAGSVRFIVTHYRNCQRDLADANFSGANFSFEVQSFVSGSLSLEDAVLNSGGIRLTLPSKMVDEVSFEDLVFSGGSLIINKTRFKENPINLSLIA